MPRIAQILLLGLAAFLSLATAPPKRVYQLVSVSPGPDERGFAPTVQPQMVFDPERDDVGYGAILEDQFSLVAAAGAEVPAQIQLEKSAKGQVTVRAIPVQPLAAGSYEFRHQSEGKRQRFEGGDARLHRKGEPDLVLRFTVGP